MRTLWISLGVVMVGLSPAYAALVTGTVVGPEGDPVAGAEVVIDTDMTMARLLTLTTDKSGKFSAELECPPYRRGLAGRAAVYAPGLAIGGGNLSPGENVIRLEHPVEARGSVVDEQGNPVVGARVRPYAIFGREPGLILMLAPLREKFTVETDAEGHWTLPGLPMSGRATLVLDDPRYAHAYSSTLLGPVPVPGEPMIARPGATIVGKVIYEDRKPAEGVRVSAQGQEAYEGWSEDVSAADGSYRLHSLPAGAYNVMVDEPTGEWVAAAIEGVKLKEGEEAHVADLVLTRGGIVEGTVTYVETGEPVVGVSVGSYGPHRPRSGGGIISDTTDQHGRYRLRVAPGESYIYIGPYSRRFVEPEGGRTNVVVAKGETKTVPFRLRKGLSVSGVAVDVDGKPAEGAKIAIGYREEFDPFEEYMELPGGSAEADAEGKFTARGLSPGRAHVSAYGEWEILDPKEIDVPTAGPARIIVSKIELATLTGRVISLDGNPVPGVKVGISAERPTETDQPTRRHWQRASDLDGRFSVSKVWADAAVSIGANKQGYRKVGGGEVANLDGVFSVSDVVLAPLSGTVEGRVVDAGGAPVAGAKVMSPEGEPGDRATADADGQFVLEGLPEGEVTVMAAHQYDFGQARIHTGGPSVTVTLAAPRQIPGSDIERGYALLEDLWRDTEEADYYARSHVPAELAPYDPDLALRLAQRPDRSVPGRSLTGIIATLADFDPARAAEWAPDKLDHISMVTAPDEKLRATTSLAMAVAAIDPELARDLYRQAKTIPVTGEASARAFGYASLAALAAKLGYGEAELMVESAIAAAQEHSDSSGLLDAVAESVAEGDIALAERVVMAAPQTGRPSALARVIETIAPRDAAAAQRLLARLADSSHDENKFHFGRAAKYVIEAIGEQDPAGALALARRVEGSSKPIALALAARFQSKEVAGGIFREAVEAAGADYNWRRVGPKIASMAMEVDRELGIELFEQIRTRASLKKATSDTDFVFYYTRVDPAESRLLIESRFAALTRKPDPHNPGWSMVGLALAMAAVDVERALEMAESIPEDGSQASFDVRRKLAQYVLAPEEVRRTLAFDRWGASDTWIPGTPTGW